MKVLWQETEQCSIIYKILVDDATNPVLRTERLPPNSNEYTSYYKILHLDHNSKELDFVYCKQTEVIMGGSPNPTHSQQCILISHSPPPAASARDCLGDRIEPSRSRPSEVQRFNDSHRGPFMIPIIFIVNMFPVSHHSYTKVVLSLPSSCCRLVFSCSWCHPSIVELSSWLPVHSTCIFQSWCIRYFSPMVQRVLEVSFWWWWEKSIM